jgi:hypothetical protein
MEQIQRRVPELNLMVQGSLVAMPEMKIQISIINWLFNHKRKRYPGCRRKRAVL